MPKELYELRKAQLKKLQNAKERGDTKYFSKKYPDKLFINGKLIPLKYLLLSLICQYANMPNYDTFYIIISSFLFFSHLLFNFVISIKTSVLVNEKAKLKPKQLYSVLR